MTKRNIPLPIVGTFALVGIVALLAIPRRDRRPVEPQPPSRASTPLDTVPLQQPVGSFVYLVDVSGSTNKKDAKNPLLSATRLIEPSVTAIAQLDELLPQRHQVATIKSLSLDQEVLCTINMREQTLFTATDQKAQKVAIAACADSIAKIKPEQFSDITNGIYYAALRLGLNKKQFRAMLVFSDFEEEPPPGMNAATPNLRGICAVFYMIVTPSTAAQPQLIARRDSIWRGKARAWHAKQTLFRTILSFDPAELQEFLRKCEG